MRIAFLIATVPQCQHSTTNTAHYLPRRQELDKGVLTTHGRLVGILRQFDGTSSQDSGGKEKESCQLHHRKGCSIFYVTAITAVVRVFPLETPHPARTFEVRVRCSARVDFARFLWSSSLGAVRLKSEITTYFYCLNFLLNENHSFSVNNLLTVK